MLVLNKVRVVFSVIYFLHVFFVHCIGCVDVNDWLGN